MIVFDLRCEQDHAFEGWFPDSAGFEAQRQAGEIVCPVCGSPDIRKALMTPNIAKGDDDRPPSGQHDVKEQTRQLYANLRKLRDHVEANCDYVGDKFPEEARKIHYGETEKRDIYGEASPDDAKELADEGVPVTPIPWLPRQDG